MLDEIWQPLVSVKALVAAVAGALLLHGLVYRLVSRTSGVMEAAIMRPSRRPPQLLLALIGALLFLPVLQVSSEAQEVINRGLALGIIGTVGWAVTAFLGIIDDLLAARFPMDARDNISARTRQTRIRVFKSIGIAAIAPLLFGVPAAHSGNHPGRGWRSQPAREPVIDCCRKIITSFERTASPALTQGDRTNARHS